MIESSSLPLHNIWTKILCLKANDYESKNDILLNYYSNYSLLYCSSSCNAKASNSSAYANRSSMFLLVKIDSYID